ncbi:NADH:flavin oxidoreductase/NADH oxidase [Rothia aerolata]|uniref:Oxidoreductase n=1 Tax=Rothia aerolata TaxID=1812262 RepID=A0A917MQZ2_9MICC|nr:NADH:flavin oxidoreductase/NADH oxidase [Rothia aerolata]GGH57929.1 oxidoreductase [Rothia aerolata]
MASPLFEEFTVKNMTTRNRIWNPPMCQYSVEKQDGIPTSYHEHHYSALARGGAGAVIVEMTNVLPEGRISPFCSGLWSDEHTKAHARLVQAIHDGGAKAGVQIAHAGRKASTGGELHSEKPNVSLSEEEGGWETFGPSAVAYPGLKKPTALTLERIDEIVEAFGAAAARAVEAGYDFLEIHGAHGYLLMQFLSPLSNKRDDEYGGSLENRARMIRRVAVEMRKNMPADMPLLARLSATEFVEGGLTVEEIAQVAAWLKEDGVDMADISTSGNYPAEIKVYAGYQTPMAAQVKREADIPVAAVGMINSPRLAEYIVGSGQADVVLVGREALRNASTPLEWARELKQEVDYSPKQYRRAWNTRR